MANKQGMTSVPCRQVLGNYFCKIFRKEMLEISSHILRIWCLTWNSKMHTAWSPESHETWIPDRQWSWAPRGICASPNPLSILLYPPCLGSCPQGLLNRFFRPLLLFRFFQWSISKKPEDRRIVRWHLVCIFLSIRITPSKLSVPVKQPLTCGHSFSGFW